ncbi:unnamed protein product [Lactuca virosa]|uniref:Glutaredoxin domain-containing protein n=1 Tax=Lactuca virosa TaxID=75947 RepID=A0AAU9LSW5_9ASTR|nr:unnamed protein product [Lactuca virosa]
MKVTNPQSSSVVMERTIEVATVSTAASKMKAVYERVHHLANGNAVVLFSVSGCCMGHVAKQLLLGLGVGPTVVELDKETTGVEIHDLLYRLAAGNDQQQPILAISFGGKFLGGIKTLIACHINDTLVPLLKDAGAMARGNGWWRCSMRKLSNSYPIHTKIKATNR